MADLPLGARGLLSNEIFGSTNANPSAPTLADLLSGNRPEARGLYFNGKNIKLDGYRFVGCRFDGCTLEITSTNFEIIECVLDPSTRIIYGNTVLKIIQLFNSRQEWSYGIFPPGFVPQKNPNGSITISDKAS